MPKTTSPLFIQAVLFQHSEEFDIQLNTVERKSNEFAMFITLAERSVTFDMPEIDNEKLTLAHIDHLKGLKDQVKAKAQLDIQSLDDQINNLLCLDNKVVA